MRYFLVILSLLLFFSCGDIKQPPGVLAPDKPKQSNVAETKTWDKDDYHFTALAKFDLQAKVLGKEKYRFDRESDIAPYDLALGWGRMSDQDVVDYFDISQRMRWFFWQTDKYPIPRKEIENSSANMHIIPASEKVEDELDDLLVGEIILIEGYLVAVKADDGWKWKSSLSRNDTGNGACEVVWVDKLLRLK
ncbi:MAG: hypothetical protein ABFS12_12480 [Bacteroidota bacterium]